MKIAFNPSTVAALTTPPNNKDITFDLRGRNIFARGVKFCGTDTNTWRDIKINNVSIGSNILDLRNGSNTTLTNTNGVVTINSTWRPVVDNLTSDSTTSSLSAKQGKILKSLIDGKSNSGHTHDDRYLKLTGGTMASNALITFADSGSWGTDKGPQGARGGLYWTGQSDYAKLYAEETAGDNLDLVIQFGDDNSNGLSIRNKANTQTSYISASGVITTGTFKGNLDWSYITNKPSSYTPSAHTHAWNSLTHSSTTENQAILTNGKANGWKLYTLNISRWDNAANNAHSHSNKSVLDGITSALVNNWNTAYTFVNTITGTDTDKVINKWDEIVNFLAGITEDNKLNTLLNSKLSVYELANNTNVGAIKNNGIYYSTTDASSGTLTNSPFNTGFALINMTSYDGGDDLRRSRLAFNAYGEIKVSNDRGQNNTTETWYQVLTSHNTYISNGSGIINGTTITQVSNADTTDGVHLEQSGQLTYDQYSWLAAWANDGKKIKAVNKSQFATSGHTHDDRYLKLSGGTMTGIIRATNRGGSWISGRDHCLIRSDDKTSYSYWSAILAIATVKGYWTLGHLGDGGEKIGFNYDTDADYNAGRNNDHVIWLPTGGAEGTLALTSDIPTSLKNPHALTISLNGTSQGPYDGSAAKNVNITPGSIGAASSNHNHDNRYVRKWTGVYGNANKFLKLVISEEKGWIRLEVSDSNNALSGGYGIYIVGWGWHGNNGTDTLFARCLYANDSRYTTALKVVKTSRNNYDFYFQFASGSSYPSYTINYSSSVSSIDCTVTAIDTIPTATWTSSLSALQLNASQVDWSGITNKPSVFNPAAHTHSWTSITDKLVAGNEFNIVNAEFNNRMWFNYLPINNRDSTATVRSYHFGNGAKGYAPVQASGFIKTGSSSSYVLLGDGGHQTISSLSVNYANSAGSASNLTVSQYLSNTDTTWYPLIWGGNDHRNTYTSTGGIYKSQDVLSWQTSSQTLHATNLYTGRLETINNHYYHFNSDATLRIYGSPNGNTERIYFQVGIDNRMDDYDIPSYGGEQRHSIILNPRGGFVGIGTTNPSYKLSVGGDIGTGGNIYISHNTNNNMNYNTSNPRIVFSENGSQAVGLVYTDYDSYRLSKGLKVMDVNNDDTSNVWFEVQGYNYSSGYVKNGSNDNYVLLGGGGHKLESSLNVAHATTSGRSWDVSIQGQHWSRLYVGNPHTLHHSSIFSISGSIGCVVFCQTFLVESSHSGNATIICLFSGSYTQPKMRALAKSDGTVLVDLFWSGNDCSQSSSTQQMTIHVIANVLQGSISPTTTLTNDDTIPNGYSNTCEFQCTSKTSNFYNIRATGNSYATHFYESSDKTLKKNIKSILSSTNIPKIREFDWKDTGEHSYGFIAQELEEQGYGCLVSEANGKKTVNYTATLALTVAKLQNLINIQNKKISNLTKELKALKYGRKKNS